MKATNTHEHFWKLILNIWVLGKNDFEYLAVVGLFNGNGLTDVRNLSTI